jgi:hypothetical protein
MGASVAPLLTNHYFDLESRGIWQVQAMYVCEDDGQLKDMNINGEGLGTLLEYKLLLKCRNVFGTEVERNR